MLKTFDDVWYPKSEYVTTDGRVNKKGSPMLYCSLDMVTPIFECGVEDEDWYAIIQYKIKGNKSIQVYNLVLEQLPPNLNEKGKINHMIISDFLTTEFCKEVGVGTEYLYKISNSICSNFLDMPYCGGYIYPSIANFKKGYNVALKPTAVDEALKFDCLLICQRSKWNSEKNGYDFYLKHKANHIIGGCLIYNF